MKLNRIQQQLFVQLSKDLGMELSQYLEKYSPDYLGKSISALDQMTEEDADKWIMSVYVQSLQNGHAC